MSDLLKNLMDGARKGAPKQPEPERAEPARGGNDLAKVSYAAWPVRHCRTGQMFWDGAQAAFDAYWSRVEGTVYATDRDKIRWFVYHCMVLASDQLNEEDILTGPFAELIDKMTSEQVDGRPFTFYGKGCAFCDRCKARSWTPDPSKRGNDNTSELGTNDDAAVKDLI